MFPPSDSNSLENSNDNVNGKAAPASIADDRGPDGLIPYGGMSSPGGTQWGYGFPMRPEILSAKPDIGNLLHSLRRRKWLAIFLGLVLGGSLGALAWFLLPTRYESAALLRVRINTPGIWQPENGIDFEQYKRNAIAMIRGAGVINKALDDKTIQDFPMIKKNSADLANWLADALTVDPGSGELLRISVRDYDPNGLTEICNAVVQAYMNEVVVKERSDKLLRRDNLQKKYLSLKQGVLDKERQLNELNEQLGTRDAETAHGKYKLAVDALDSAMRTENEIDKQILDVTFKAEMTQLLAKNAENNDVPETELEAAISRDPQIQQATQELSQLSREQREVEKVVKGKNDPAAVRIRAAISILLESIDQIKNADRQQLIEQYKAGGKASSSNMKALELEVRLLTAHREKIDKDKEARANDVQKLERFNGDADQLRKDIEQQQVVVRNMSETLAKWSIEMDAEERVGVYQAASTPIAVAPARQYVVAGFAGVFGFGLALFGVTFFEFLSRKLNASHELIDGLGIRVMGDLPALRRRIGLRQRSRRATHGIVAESINGIRATLLRNAESGSSNVFLVTSAGEQEGKTTVASQLAASLARGGRKTLLIDADLRHPGAHLVFGLQNEEGFCELLRGEAEVDDAIRPTPADNLWMITAGRCCATSVMALGKEAVAQIIGELEARFEFIVIDTGPVLKVADALLLGAHVDGAILSVLRDVSRIHKVYEANERLKLAGVKVVGAVVNGIEDRGSLDRYHVEMSAA